MSFYQTPTHLTNHPRTTPQNRSQLRRRTGCILWPSDRKARHHYRCRKLGFTRLPYQGNPICVRESTLYSHFVPTDPYSIALFPPTNPPSALISSKTPPPEPSSTSPSKKTCSMPSSPKRPPTPSATQKSSSHISNPRPYLKPPKTPSWNLSTTWSQ